MSYKSQICVSRAFTRREVLPVQKELEPAASIQNLDDIARATVKSTSQVPQTIARTSFLSSTAVLYTTII